MSSSISSVVRRCSDPLCLLLSGSGHPTLNPPSGFPKPLGTPPCRSPAPLHSSDGFLTCPQERIGPLHSSDGFPTCPQERIGPLHSSDGFPTCPQERIDPLHTSDSFPTCPQERIGPLHTSGGFPTCPQEQNGPLHTSGGFPTCPRSAVLAGLKNAQGKCIVNSISLKDGENSFLRKALTIKDLGGAMVVMAFDKAGQATTFERKIEVCRRAYDLLTGNGIAPEDIIFDVNVLSIATGDPADRRYAVDFIEAVRWIKANLPGALTSGGISNLSFAFRGNNAVREAMHAVFLYHAIKAGLDMAIVNPGMLQIYDEIDPVLRSAAEDVILDRDLEAAARLIEAAASLVQDSGCKESSAKETTDLQHLLVKGSDEGLEELLMAQMAVLGGAREVI